VEEKEKEKKKEFSRQQYIRTLKVFAYISETNQLATALGDKFIRETPVVPFSRKGCGLE
jgi:hypothetical protein